MILYVPSLGLLSWLSCELCGTEHVKNQIKIVFPSAFSLCSRQNLSPFEIIRRHSDCSSGWLIFMLTEISMIFVMHQVSNIIAFIKTQR